MNRTIQPRLTPAARRGLTVVEMLISLALMAALLASIAGGMYASMRTFEENDDMAAVSQSSRYILNRMTSEVRTADAVDASSPTLLRIIPPPNVENIAMIEYQFSSGTLIYKRTIAGVTTSSVLLDTAGDVQIKSFTATPVLGPDSQGVTCTKSVTIRMELQAGNKTFPMTASASPRRNQTL